MADPLSISASVLAVITAAIQSTSSLCATVGRFKERNKTLKNLQHELEDLTKILSSLKQAVDTDAAILLLLEGPVQRCSRVCNEFEQSMSAFSSKSKVGFLDWAKMEFRRGNITEFAETIGGYKATISIGLGVITMSVIITPHRLSTVLIYHI
jgi:Rad3-related DNA helicase